VRELRKRVSKLKEDRMLAPDIEAIAAMVRSGDLLQAAL